MKKINSTVRVWILRGVVILLGVGVLLWILSGSSHDPNHDINMDQARAAARRVHTPPDPSIKMGPGHGG